MKGAVFGGQIGYNWQMGAWVFGIEGDYDGVSISGTGSAIFPSRLAPGHTDAFTATEKINWLASLRGRVGYAFGLGMLYFTGGGAWEGVTTDATISANTGVHIFSESAAGSFSATRSGFVVGTGYEVMIDRNWTARAEYLFYDFGKSDTNSLALPSCMVPGCGVNIANGGNHVNEFRLGVNYKF
jgi:outer membrane immunogenic protein